MKVTVILKNDEYVEYEDCHAVVDSAGDVTIANLADEVVDERYHGAWKSVTTFA